MAEAPPYTTAGVEVLRLPAGSTERDAVAVEEPLEIRVNGEPVAVTMRTPGHDEELALGFCLSEGIQPVAARLPADLAANTVEVDAPGFDPARLRRNFFTSSSCGVCGKGALEAVAVEAPRVEAGWTVPRDLVASLPERLRAGQGAFAATGGIHATGLFDREGDAALRARGRRPAQRDGQGRRLGVRRTAACRSPTRSSASAGGSRSSSCRRRRWPDVRCSSPSVRLRASPSSSRPTAESRSAASFAAGA